MKIQNLVVGDFQVNCYILTDGDEAIVIDPGYECGRILSAIENEGATLSKIILTHGHFDHIGAVCDLQEKTGAKVYIHKEDEVMLSDNDKNLANVLNGNVKLVPPDYRLEELIDDYNSMKEMISGNIPTFNNIIAALKELEAIINL